MMNKVLLLGGTGLVGSRVLKLLAGQFEIIAPTQSELDVTSAMQVKDGVQAVKPTAILYAAGFTNVDLAERAKQECYLLNVSAVEFFTSEAAELNIPFYYLSTDYVFDGTKQDRPYNEEDEPHPLTGVYAQSKRGGELVTLKVSPKNSVIRLIMPFSAVYTRKLDIARLILSKLQNGEKIDGVVDQKINPIFVDDLVRGIGKIVQNCANGIYHIAATNFTTPYQFMKEIARQFKLSQDLIGQMTFEEFTKTRPAKRPQHTWLDTIKFRKEFGDGILHTVEEEIKLFKSQIDSTGGFS